MLRNRMVIARIFFFAIILGWCSLSNIFLAAALEPGHASGTCTMNGVTSRMNFAVAYATEGLFDDTKKDMLIVITDRALGATKPDSEIEITRRAHDGELVVLTARIDGEKLVNVGVTQQDIPGTMKLPGTWFQFTTQGELAGKLTLEKREWENNSYLCDLEFSATRYSPPAPE